MASHSAKSPSKAVRWIACPGSIREEAKYPEQPSGPAAADGTHSHTLLEHCVEWSAGRVCYDPMLMVGHMMRDHEGDFEVDEARAKRVKVATDYIDARVAEYKGPVEVLAEERVDPAFLLGRDDMSGTADVRIRAERMLEVIDYKDGIVQVEAKDNPQMEIYALGDLSSYGIAHNLPQPYDTVRLTIIQPKLALKGLSPISSHDMSIHELLRKVAVYSIAARDADQPDAPLVAGEAQCKYCRAKGGCSALAGSVMKEIGVMFQPVAPVAPSPVEAPVAQAETLDMAQQSAGKNPETMSDDQIRQIMEAAPLMRQLLEGVEKEAQRRLESGRSIAGLKLVNGRGSRAWSLDEEAIAARLVKMGVPKSEVYITKLVSPAQAEKLAWTKRDGTKVTLTDRQLKTMNTEYITKLAGKLTVAPESDSRPAVTMDASTMFQAVPEAPALPSWLM